MSTVKKVEVHITDEEKSRQERISRKPDLTEILNLHDFEVRDNFHVYRYTALIVELNIGDCSLDAHGQSMGVLFVSG